MSLATNIRKLRRAADISQARLGDIVGVGQGAVSDWETGKSQPKASDLPKIALALGSTLDRLLRGVSDR